MLAVTALIATVGGLPSAVATPVSFPDLSSYPAVDLAPYEVRGSHPSSSGWAFSTLSGVKCRDSLIAELGVYCQRSVAGSDEAALPVTTTASVALTAVAEVVATRAAETSSDLDSFPVLPTGSKIAADNGVVCAAISDDCLACLAKKPESWPADTPDPPDRHYGEHGFVLTADGNSTF